MTAAFAAGMLILLPLSVRAQEVQPAVTAENHTEETMEQPEDIIFVGDSRFVQMKNAVGENPYRWIAKGSQGYDWFVEEAVAQIDAAVQSGTKILINFGVNDVANEAAYAELVNRKAAEWEALGAEVYYSSVNPVEDGRYVTKEKVADIQCRPAGGSGRDGGVDRQLFLAGGGWIYADGRASFFQ